MSPTSIRRIESGTAFNSEFIRIMSIIDDSSTIKRSPSNGFSSLRRFFACLMLILRQIVLVFRSPVDHGVK